MTDCIVGPDLLEHEVLLAGALQLPSRVLPIPPYTLGAWLGDGDTRGHGTFTCHPRDAEVVEQIRLDGFPVTRRAGKYEWGIRKLRVLLRAAGLVGRKVVPPEYLRASADQRLALLQGLMDTDGYVSARGQCAFDNTNRALVEDARELMLSLGLKPGAVQVKPNLAGHQTMYRVTFTRGPGSPVPFRLRRKMQRARAGVEARGRLVRSVTAVPSVETRCIQVAHPSGTFLAGREMVVTHNSGILAVCPPWNRPRYYPSKRRVVWPNGAQATLFSAEEPERTRGPQHDAMWGDEPASWPSKEVWDNAAMGLRLGKRPIAIVTGTPKPVPMVLDLLKDPKTRVTKGSTFENTGNLAPAFIAQVKRIYSGTRIGRQELNAEVLEDMPGALFSQLLIDLTRVREAPQLERVVISVDPPLTSESGSDECGIMAVGRGQAPLDVPAAARATLEGPHAYVLKDHSVGGTPNEWARAAVKAYYEHKADALVAEINAGGEMVETVVRGIDPNINFVPVRAMRGKAKRAEPCAALYEQFKVHHVGHPEKFTKLEKQQRVFTGMNGRRDDRADATNWALHDLVVENAFVGLVG